MDGFITVVMIVFLATSVVLALSAAGTKDESTGNRSMVLAMFLAALTVLAGFRR